MSEPELQPPSSAKSCTVCGIDVTNKPRVKDAQGRYMCKECFDTAKAALDRRNAPPPATSAAKAGGKAGVDLSDNSFLLGMGKADSVAASGTKPCPECGRPLNPNATVCVGCGLNLETGKRMQVKVVKAKVEKVKAAEGSSLLANPTVVCWGVLLLFAAVAGLSFVTPAASLIYVLLLFLLGAVVGVWLLIDAFRESVTTGILCLVCGPYQIYWLLTRCENAMLKGLWLVDLVAVGGLIVLAMTGVFEGLPGQK